MKKIHTISVGRERQQAGALFRPERLKTELAFKTTHQAYTWFTDRGRSRVIKH